MNWRDQSRPLISRLTNLDRSNELSHDPNTLIPRFEQLLSDLNNEPRPKYDLDLTYPDASTGEERVERDGNEQDDYTGKG